MRRSLINEPENLVPEALEGLVLAHPDLLELNAEHRFVRRRSTRRGKVGLVSGGGSGHEPLHAGFVGKGMLDVAIAGAVFASPTALQILEGTKAADTGAGVVQVVKNYTGDVLNFRIAGDIAGDSDVETEIVLVDDDLATTGDGDGPGARGTGATLMVEKIAGAAAEQGADLRTTAELGRSVIRRSQSLAFSLDAPTHPGASEPQFVLKDSKVELGVGIHGERGTGRIGMGTADQLMEELVQPLVDHMVLGKGSSVVALVNGLGGTYPLELQVATRAVHQALGARGVEVARTLTGSYVTSLSMHGVSLTLLDADEELLRLWDAPVRTPGLTW